MSPWPAVLLVVAVETVCGLGVLALLGVARSGRELRRYAALAPLGGMAWVGVASSTLATVGARLGLVGLVALTLATCAAGAFRLRRSRTASEDAQPARGTLLERAFAAVFLLGIAAIALFALAAYYNKPLADYDGWAIWGTKARALALLGSADADVFAGQAYERLHLEYPLVIPGLHALPLQALDDYASVTVILSCFAIGAAGLLAIWGVYRDRVRPALVLGFLTAILAMPAFLKQLGTGYGDVPLALLVAAGIAAAARWLVDGDRAWLVLATLFLAASALTKNEGLLFSACAYVALFLAAGGHRRAVAASAGVAALAYVPWQLYTAAHGLERKDVDLSKSFDLPWVVDRLDRAPEAARELLQQAVLPRQFGVGLVLGVAAAVVALVVGNRRLGSFAAGFGILCGAGLTWIYVVSPLELDFYLFGNKERVIAAPIVGLAALAPLLVEESARALRAVETSEDVGKPR